MVFFITVLRAMSAMIITNSHYTGFYPTDLIANGGLLGDVIFFAVSGYCLFNIKMPFGKWYLKRLLRVYPSAIIITLIYILVGWYQTEFSFKSLFWWFAYPTNYHFVASIIVLYIPFYFVAKLKPFRENLPKVMIGVFVAYMLVYAVAYDKSYYHIDTVREPMIRFLFFESMLLGAWFRQNSGKVKDAYRGWHWGLSAAFFVLYFGSKMIFSGVEKISGFQCINQIILFMLLFGVFWCFSGINEWLERAFVPGLKKAVTFVSERTLEIYVVQYAIISFVRDREMMFPLNWFAVTAAIIVAATALHFVVGLVNKQTDRLFER